MEWLKSGWNLIGSKIPLGIDPQPAKYLFHPTDKSLSLELYKFSKNN